MKKIYSINREYKNYFILRINIIELQKLPLLSFLSVKFDIIVTILGVLFNNSGILSSTLISNESNRTVLSEFLYLLLCSSNLRTNGIYNDKHSDKILTKL